MPRRLQAAALATVLIAPAAARADAIVAGSHRTELLDCTGADAVVDGDGNRLVFHGDCRGLRINGSGNVVEIDLVPGGPIVVAGQDNQVLYTPVSPGPVVTAEGAGNQIAAGTGGAASAALAPPVPPAPPPAAVLAPPANGGMGTLVLTGDGQDRDVGCTGRNVLIDGSNGRFVLRGGCRSVTVQGRADTITAELLPGARIGIAGDGVTLHYTMTAAGPPPVVSVTGNFSRALPAASGAP